MSDPSPNFASRRSAAAGAAGLLVLAILATYHNSFGGPFVLDDAKSIVDNPTLRHLWPIRGPLSPPADIGLGGRPLLNLSLAVNYALGGTEVWSYHALNLLIHIFSALALFGIVRQTLAGIRTRGAAQSGAGDSSRSIEQAISQSPDLYAFLTALLWAVHPLQTSSVTYIIQRAESLMGLFYLLTLYCFIRYASEAAHSARGRQDRAAGRPGWAGLSILACLCGMATKEVMATAPLIVLLYDRTFIAGTFREAGRRRWIYYCALASTWILRGALMTGLSSRGVGFVYGVSGWDYALTECAVVLRYLGLALWPHPLVLDYNTPLLTQVGIALPYAAILLPLLAGSLWALWRRPILGFVGAWFFVILAPTSSFIPVALQPMAENRMYLPLAAVVVLVVGGIAALARRRSLVVGLVLAAGLAWLTVERNEDYRTEVGIWTDTVNKGPDNPRAQYNLATVLLKDGRAADAIPHLERARQLTPDDPDVLYDLGFALAGSRRFDESIAQYEQALRLRPNWAKIHNDLGIVLAQSGRPPEAIAQFAEAVRLDPAYAEAENNWGNTLYELRRAAEASDHLEAAVRLQPASAQFRVRLAMALAQSGRAADAIAQFEAALRLRPSDANTHYNLGLLLRSAGQIGAAAEQFQAAAQLEQGGSPGAASP